MRAPVCYSPSEIVNWTVAEEYAPGKWRPARCCAFGNIFSHVMMRLRITWGVFTGRLDALNWGATSGEPKSEQRRYKDCTEPEFFTATKVYEPPQGKGF